MHLAIRALFLFTLSSQLGLALITVNSWDELVPLSAKEPSISLSRICLVRCTVSCWIPSTPLCENLCVFFTGLLTNVGAEFSGQVPLYTSVQSLVWVFVIVPVVYLPPSHRNYYLIYPLVVNL